MRMPLKRFSTIAFALTLWLTPAYAQSVAARISGTVTDPTRAAVPGATVTAVETTTGRKLAATSAVDGQYVLYPLPPALDPATGRRRYGNAGRNIIAGPGLNRLDGSLNKSFKVRSEARRVVFRLDMFNIANHPNWGNPATNISSVNTVATIGSVNGSMRQAQFALEFQF